MDSDNDNVKNLFACVNIWKRPEAAEQAFFYWTE